MKERPIPYLVANSNMSFLEGNHRYSLEKTIEYAARVKADGTQLHTSQVDEGKEDPVRVHDGLDTLQINKNIVHLGGLLTPDSFRKKGKDMIGNAVKMIDPIPGLGLVCVVHHDSGSTENTADIADMVEKALTPFDEPIVLGLECVIDAKNGPVNQQVDRYVETYIFLLARRLPIIPVFDARNLHDMSRGKQLEDPDDENLKLLCKVSAFQKAVMHARDVKSINDSYKKGNFVQIGKGAFAELHKKVVELGEENHISWQALVDENQETVIEDATEIDQTLERLKLA